MNTNNPTNYQSCSDIIHQYIMNIIDHKIDTPPEVPHKDVAFGDINENFRDLIFYTGSKTSDNSAVIIEQQIVLGLGAIYAILNKSLQVKTNEGTNISYSPMLYAWQQIIILVNDHRVIFKEEYDGTEHFFSNFYLNNLEQLIIDTAEKVAEFCNSVIDDEESKLNTDKLLRQNVIYIDPETQHRSTIPSILPKAA